MTPNFKQCSQKAPLRPRKESIICRTKDVKLLFQLDKSSARCPRSVKSIGFKPKIKLTTMIMVKAEEGNL